MYSYIILFFLRIFVFCFFSPQVCRMAFEIMNSFYPDASNRCTSIDGIYTFAHFNRILNEAVFSHRPRRYYELGLSKGDVIVPISNYKNGTSFGTNINTNKSGRYPSFKVTVRDKTFDTYYYTCKYIILGKNQYIIIFFFFRFLQKLISEILP